MLFLLRQNVVQAVAGEVFGVSQATVSRGFEALRAVVVEVLADLVPTPEQVASGSTVLVDGTVARTWDWKHRDDLFSGKGLPMNERFI